MSTDDETSSQHEKPKSLFGLHRGQYEIIGDIDEVPLFVEWDADAWRPVADPRISKGKPDWLSSYGKDGQDSSKEPGMSTDDETSPTPRLVKASEFQEKCLDLVAEVAESGAEIIITEDGKPVAKLSPHRNDEKPAQGDPGLYFGRQRGKIQVYGDIVGPMPADWFADADIDTNENRPETVAEVTENGGEVIITKDDNSGAKPATNRDALELAFGRYEGQFGIYGDIVAPMPAEWFAVPDDSEGDPS